MGKLVCGNALEILPGKLDAESVHCCISSPPYWGLRDYGCPEVIFGGDEGCEHEWGAEIVRECTNAPGSAKQASNPGANYVTSRSQFCQLCGAWRGQFGLEPTPEMYVEHTLEFLRAIWRVLRKDGTVWWNIGDSYATHASKRSGQFGNKIKTGFDDVYTRPKTPAHVYGLKEKDLVMIPFRVALAAQADGWWVRSVIIWHKPNPMPESVRDRPTTSHEYVLLMAKNKHYYYDGDAIREAGREWTGQAGTFARESGKATKLEMPGQNHVSHRSNRDDRVPTGRNKRTVWTISTKPYSGPHYSTFPPDLIEPMILAGTSPKVCAECGAPWERVVDKPMPPAEMRKTPSAYGGKGVVGHGGGQPVQDWLNAHPRRTLGWRPTCSCNAGTKPATVADIFCGTGTVAEKAIEHGRDYVMIDIDPKSIEMAEERIAQVQIRLPLMTADHDKGNQ